MTNRLPPHSRILEGVMTTLAVSPEEEKGVGSRSPILPVACSEKTILDTCFPNIAPMGPIVDSHFKRFVFRPFTTTTTYRNLKSTGEGVFHVTDDVLLIARAAMGTITVNSGLAMKPARHVRGVVLADACRYYEFRVLTLDDRQERTRIEAKVLSTQTHRDFFGFNRARHAVLEAAILATRLFLTGPQFVLAELDRLQMIVDKTGSGPEHTAMKELRCYIETEVETSANMPQQPSAEATEVD